MTDLTPYQQTQLARYGRVSDISDTDLIDMPVEYATGRAEFCGLPLFVSKDVLIPRIETEELVELALQTVSEKLTSYQTQSTLRIAEVGTGSGAVTVALAKHLAPFAGRVEIIAGDISKAALAVAQKNQQQFLHNQEPKVTFLESDLLKKFHGTFDMIVANLPYIPTENIKGLESSVRDYEPVLALDGGPRGLTQIYRLLDQAVSRLNPKGVVLLEIDDSHSIVDFQQFGQYFEVEVLQDSFSKNRFARLVFSQQAYTA
jgi:release factor glutamine methyltransferase